VKGTPGSKRVALFIPDLSVGGSERQLLELAKGMIRCHQDLLIITIYDTGALLHEARSIPGLKVITLRKRNPLLFTGRLLRVMWHEQVGLLYSFLSIAQFYSLAVKLFFPGLKLVFRIGNSIGPTEYFGRKDALVELVLRLFSRLPDFYVLNSQAAKASKALAVPAERVRVVYNGIDTERFQPSASWREEFRRTLGVVDDVFVIGCLATFSVYKDHPTFVEAAKLVKDAMSNVCFLTIGDDTTVAGQEAHERVRRLGLKSCFRFLGARNDVETILPACDVGCSTSMTEGFSNAIGEFMACGVPCVVTDAGDSSLIVGDVGLVTPKGNPRAVADGILRLLRLSAEERAVLGQRSRSRVVVNWSISRMVEETIAILAQV